MYVFGVYVGALSLVSAVCNREVGCADASNDVCVRLCVESKNESARKEAYGCVHSEKENGQNTKTKPREDQKLATNTQI